jgi:hypothetical protein
VQGFSLQRRGGLGLWAARAADGYANRIPVFAENRAVRVRERTEFTLTRYRLDFPRKKRSHHPNVPFATKINGNFEEFLHA